MLKAVYEIHNNRWAIDQLVMQLQSPVGVIPFVGAGLSVPYGYKSWTDFLLTTSPHSSVRRIIADLIADGCYEEAAEKLLAELGPTAFNDQIRLQFGVPPTKKRPFTAAALLPAIVNGPVITTNFDHVLEFVFESEEPFEAVLSGAKAEMLIDAVHRNKRYLLKIHGDALDRTGRVLTRAEYSNHYGAKAPAEVDWSLPLPKTLRLLLTARPALFLGCSLVQDRTVAVLERVCNDHPGLTHYSIIEAPDSSSGLAERSRQLSEHGIRPIWYPAGRHEYVPHLLKHLLDRSATKTRISDSPLPAKVLIPPPAASELCPDTDVLVIYSEQDETMAKRLITHLTTLVKSGQIGNVIPKVIDNDSNWKYQPSTAIESVHVILLLISADFLASDYCLNSEMGFAMTLHEAGKTRVVPVIISPALWRSHSFGALQPLPRDGKPITLWDDIERALMNVAANVQLICAELQAAKQGVDSLPTLSQRHKLVDVYTASAVPTVTFVEPENFLKLKLALEQQGRGVVIEGPSGIGKTTALKKAVEQARSLRGKKKIKILSARRQDHVKVIEQLHSQHEGTVVIDDFHKLEASLQRQLSDYLKYLADYEVVEKKLVIVGIPQTGRRLTEIAFDLATRIEVFKFHRVSDETVLRMIEKGEAALNIKLDRKADIVRASSGSLNIAQLLCFNLAEQNGVVETQPICKAISCDVDSAISDVVQKLALKFERPISTFVNMSGTGDITCLELLKELVDTSDGFINLERMKSRRTDLAAGIDRLLRDDYVGSVHRQVPDSEKMLLLDPFGPTLVIDDPQLVFYLVQTPASRWIGSETVDVPRKRNQILIAFSPEDHAFAERLRLHLSQHDRLGELRFWEAAEPAIPKLADMSFADAASTARMILFLLGPEFCASICMHCNQLDKVLRVARKEGVEILSVNVKPCQVPTELSQMKGLNPPERTLLEMSYIEQERLWATVASMIEANLLDRHPGPGKSFRASHK
jgi:hypothetical protein